VFLVGLRSKKASAEPGASHGLFDVTIVEQGFDMFLDDGAFVNAISTLAASHRLSCTGVHAKFEAEHRSTSTFGGESIPIVMDDG